MSNEFLVYAAMQAEGVAVAFTITAILSFIGGFICICMAANAWSEDERPRLYKIAIKGFIVFSFLMLIAAVIPDRKTILAMYLLPKIEAGAVNFKNVPPKLAKMIEVKMDEYIEDSMKERKAD